MATPPPSDAHDLSAQLASSSTHFAQSALESLSTGQHPTFLLHAATALEHLAKAVLAHHHPSLIVARNDFESLLHVCGKRAFATVPRSRIRTISADDAIVRVGSFAPTVKRLRDDLNLLVLVRNGVVHLGESSTVDADVVLVPYLRASEELREALGIERADYWGRFVGLVDTALRERAEQVHVKVEMALVVARREFVTRFGGLDDVARDAMIAIVESSYRRDSKYEEQFSECPVCQSQARYWGSLKVEYDEDWDHHERVLIGVHPIITFIPSSLECGLCGLELDGRDEMDAAGAGESWMLDDVDERDFFDEDGAW